MKTNLFCPNCFQSDCFNGRLCYQCGYEQKAAVDSRAMRAGVLLKNRYFLGRVLGIGGFGITYLAFDSRLRQRCAVKEYFPVEWAVRMAGTNQIEPNSQLKDELYYHGKDVFVKEANILLEFQRESHIVNVRDFFEQNGTAYLVMEYVQGVTLSLYMREQNKPLSIALANQMVQEIGDSLHRVHKKNLLHRDISPDNIMYDNKGEMKLIDFGATREFALNSPQSISVMVKPSFAPIEQYSRSGRQGPHTDVYGLAATYYYVVSGKKLPTAPDREAGVEIKPLKELLPHIPSHINAAINHALQKKWQTRTRNMKEFVHEMHLSHRIVSDGRQKSLAFIIWQGQGENQRIDLIHNQIKIGRNRAKCQYVITNPQISGEHCEVTYDTENNQFYVKNYSRNYTYTKFGALLMGQSVTLKAGEWFYLQTQSQRYLFFLEVNESCLERKKR